MANDKDNKDKQLEQISKDVRITNSSEQWQRFDNWMSRYGYQRLAEGFRAAMNKIIELEADCTKCINSGQ